MKLKKLKIITLSDALRGMEIGESCMTPDNLTVQTIRVTCAKLKSEGLLFATNGKIGCPVVTRLK